MFYKYCLFSLHKKYYLHFTDQETEGQRLNNVLVMQPVRGRVRAPTQKPGPGLRSQPLPPPLDASASQRVGVSSCLSGWHLAASLPGTPFLPFCSASSPSAFPLSFFQSWLRYRLCQNVLPNFLARGLAAPTLRPSLGYSGPLALVYDSVFPTSPCAPRDHFTRNCIPRVQKRRTWFEE